MNGMYYKQKSWTMLSRTAKKGSRTIIVSGDVTGWPIGSTIAIASTDYSFRPHDPDSALCWTAALSRSLSGKHSKDLAQLILVFLSQLANST